MTKFFFVESYKHLAKGIYNRNLSEEFFQNSAEKLNTENWDEDIIREVFADLSLSDQRKTDIYPAAIRDLYWQKYKRKNHKDGSSTEPQRCSRQLCDGFGVLKVIAPKGTELVASPGFRSSAEYEYVFRCDCILGQSHPSYPKFTRAHQEAGYYIPDDSRMTDEKFRETRGYELSQQRAVHIGLHQDILEAKYNIR